MLYHLVTWHGLVVTKSPAMEAAPLTQGLFLEYQSESLLTFDASAYLPNPAGNPDVETIDEQPTTNEPLLADVVFKKEPGTRILTLSKHGNYLAAEKHSPYELSWSRHLAGDWESFYLISAAEYKQLRHLLSNSWRIPSIGVVNRRFINLCPGFGVSIGGIKITLDSFLHRNQLQRAEKLPEYTIVSADGASLALSVVDPARETRRRADIEPAVSRIHCGDYRGALNLLNDYESRYQDDDEIAFYRRFVLNRLAPHTPRETAIMWRCEDGAMWETSWLRYLLPNAHSVDKHIPLETLANFSVIVIDNLIDSGRGRFYEKAFNAGCQILLVHLSDEAFVDDLRVYKWCKAVFRNYYSPLIAKYKNLNFFALGYKTGFEISNNAPQLDGSSRRHVWSFVGDPNKTTRYAMLDSMRRIPGGFEHLTTGFNSADTLDVNSYRTIMQQSVFIPCPMGFHNLDSFRVYEALEAGCIPIVERRPGIDYFDELLGNNPFPSVYEWSAAVSLIEHLQNHGLVDELRTDCENWWKRYKSSVRSQFAAVFAT